MSDLRRKHKPWAESSAACYRRAYEFRLTLIEQLGGKCSNCGIKDAEVLDFHHFGPKRFTMSVTMISKRARASVLEEAKQCILLCANCHRKHHMRERENATNTTSSGDS